MEVDVQVDPRETLAEVGRGWGILVFFGIVSIITGILVMAWPEATLVVVAVLFGIQLVIGGIFRFVSAFSRDEDTGGARVLIALLGLLSLLIGLFLIRHVFVTLASMALVLGIFWIVHGLIELFAGIADTGSRSRWLSLTSGILGIVAGIIVFVYPSPSLVVLTVILGLWLILFGLLQIFSGFAARSAERSLAAT
jgi:uncharacterized membrane protein HdeD (DUF308 family)